MRVAQVIPLLLGTLGCSDTPDHRKPLTVQTPEGEVIAETTTLDPTPQTITTVTGAELKRLGELAQRGPAFLAAHGVTAPDPGLKDYDLAFRAWQISGDRRHSSQEVVEILGGYLGNKCIADLDMEWVLVNDEYGESYAVRGRNVEVMAFPFSTVEKRIEDNEHDFLYGVYYAIKQTVESGAYKTRSPD